jgi:hypothetical protein
MDQENSKDITLNKFVDIPVKIMKRRFSKVSDDTWELDPNALNLINNEAIVSMELKNDSYSSTIYFTENSDELFFRLVPGDYSLSGTLFYDGNVVIPEETRSENGISYTIPEVDFGSNGSMFPEGGIEIDHFSVSYDDLNDSKELMIYMVSMNPNNFDRVEDISQISRYKNYSSTHRIYFTPEFLPKDGQDG